jgi:hypothetical protein
MLLHSRRHIDGIPGNQEVPAGGVAGCDDLARIDANPKRHSPEHWIVLHRLPEDKRCGHCSFRVVAAGTREPEDCHHSIPDKLLERAAVIRDNLSGEVVVAPHEGTNIFGVEILAQLRRACNVGEENRHQLPLFGHHPSSSRRGWL